VAKPGDFFVGITDLFSILLPGACICFVAMRLERIDWASQTTRLGLEKEGGYVAFFVAAYIVGHLMDLCGAFCWDGLYDRTYARRRRRAPDGNVKDPLFEKARELAAPVMVKEDRVYQWSRAIACLESPTAFVEIERIQANSKFFRGLVTVFLLTPLLMILSRPLHLRYVLVELFLLVLSCMAFFRFCDLRWKAVQQTYRFFIALERKGWGRGLRQEKEHDDD